MSSRHRLARSAIITRTALDSSLVSLIQSTVDVVVNRLEPVEVELAILSRWRLLAQQAQSRRPRYSFSEVHCVHLGRSITVQTSHRSHLAIQPFGQSLLRCSTIASNGLLQYGHMRITCASGRSRNRRSHGRFGSVLRPVPPPGASPRRRRTPFAALESSRLASASRLPAAQELGGPVPASRAMVA